MPDPTTTDRIWTYALKVSEPFGVDEMCEMADAGERTVRQHLNMMAEAKFLERKGGRGTEKVTYLRLKTIEAMETEW